MLAHIDPMESDCNKEKSEEFQRISSHRTWLLISCSIEERKQAAMKIRLLTKNKSEN
ncbi:hypothetical protein ACE6H2_020508 [Prunus campanulata]